MFDYIAEKWIIASNSGYDIAICEEDSNRALAFIPARHPNFYENTKLITHAPELLEALIGLLESNCYSEEIGLNRLEAMAKAERVIKNVLGEK